MLDLKELKNIYKSITTNGVDENIIEKLSSGNIVSLVEQALLYKLDREEIKYLTLILNEVYNQDGRVFIPDTTYDELYEINKTLNGAVISGESTVGRMRFKHKYPQLRGTVGKCYFVEDKDKSSLGESRAKKKKSYEYYVTNWERILGRSLKNVQARISLKIDGVSGILEINTSRHVKQALKRGEIIDGEAFGHEISILKHVSFSMDSLVGEHAPCGLKTEVYMPMNKYKEFTEKYGKFESSRAAVTSIVNSDEVDKNKLGYLNIMDLEIWDDKENKSYLPDNDYSCIINDMTDYNAIRTIIDDLKERSDENGIPADGVVIRIMDEEIQKELGRKDAINEFEVAYKFPTAEYKTTLKGVYFSMGLGGSFTPMASIEPVRTEIGTVDSPSLGSIPRLKELNLKIGQPVYITHDVIPYLKTDGKEYDGEPITIITHCPECGTELDYKDSKLFCPNENCDGRIIGKIVKFCASVGIEGISEETVKTLYINGILKKVSDIYTMDFNLIAQIPGMGKKSAAKLKASIDEKRNLHIDVLLGSLSIPSVGKRIFGKILKHKGVQSVMKMFVDGDFSEIKSIKGIGDSVVNTLNKWATTNGNVQTLSALLTVVNVMDVKTTTSSHSVLFTKVRDKEFEKFLEGQGIAVLDSYSSAVDVVIYGAESNKTKSAVKDGKLLLTLQQAYETYGYK